MITGDEQFIPPHILATAKDVIDNALPEKSKEIYTKSKEKYTGAYENFLAWQKKQGTTSFSEPVLIAYFKELSQKLKPSSLWSIHSMLKATIDNNKSIDITKYTQLHRFVKRQNVGFQSKKSKVLTSEQVQQFLREAPDAEYLVTKVALIIGVFGACKGGELCHLTIKNIIDKDSLLHVILPDTKTHLQRSFVIDGEYYSIVKKYMDLRPQKPSIDRFFMNYRLGKCTQQPIGKNKLSNMPAQIAEYLKLPETKSYTGHSFRRTSATILADAGADMTATKRHGGWKSDRVAEGYIDDSMINKRKRSSQLTEFINSKPSTANAPQSRILSPRKMTNKEQVNVDSSSQLTEFINSKPLTANAPQSKILSPTKMTNKEDYTLMDEIEIKEEPICAMDERYSNDHTSQNTEADIEIKCESNDFTTLTYEAIRDINPKVDCSSASDSIVVTDKESKVIEMERSSSSKLANLNTSEIDFPTEKGKTLQSNRSLCDDKDNMIMHIQIRDITEKPYECKMCQKTFRHLDDFHKHMAIHTGERNLQRNVCGKMFSNVSTLHKHRTKCYNGQNEYKCNVCHKTFIQKNQFMAHMIKYITEKPYQCNICRKDFSLLQHLTSHLATHTTTNNTNETSAMNCSTT